MNKKDLLENFSNFKNIFNFEVVKCYRLIFSKKGLVSNIGSYIILSVLFIHLITTILFFSLGNKLFLNKINKVIEQKLNDNILINQTNKNEKNKDIDNLNIKKSKTTIKKRKKNQKLK